MPAEGGQPRVMTSLDSARAEAVHGFPQFLPDGRRFIYLAMSARAGESTLRVASLDSRISKTLIHADTSCAFARAFPGLGAALLFVSSGTLMAQRLDLDRAETEGERVVLAKNVRYRRWYQSQVSIADNGVLLYQEGSSERHRFTWINRDGRVTETAGPSHDAISMSLSPDERYVAFHRDMIRRRFIRKSGRWISFAEPRHSASPTAKHPRRTSRPSGLRTVKRSCIARGDDRRDAPHAPAAHRRRRCLSTR